MRLNSEEFPRCMHGSPPNGHASGNWATMAKSDLAEDGPGKPLSDPANPANLDGIRNVSTKGTLVPMRGISPSPAGNDLPGERVWSELLHSDP